MKNLIKIQVCLIVAEIFSLIAVFLFGVLFYSNYNTLKKAESYRSEYMVVVGFVSGNNYQMKPSNHTAYGYIKNEKKFILVKADSGVQKKDTVLVWSATGHEVTHLRLPHEKKFDKKKYFTQNLLITVFVFIPIIILWISERLVTKKIRKIKSK